MKMVFTSPTVVPCDMIRSVLEANGIDTLMKNERGSAPAVVGWPIPDMMALTYAWPEVWVRDEDGDTAMLVVAGLKEPPADTASWTCRKCGEIVGAELAVCWKCEIPRDLENDGFLGL